MATSRTRKPKPAAQEAPRLLCQPLESLVFLLPLILAYEIGCLLLHATARDISQERVVAFHLLQIFFELFGSTGVWMPGLAVIVILLCTHIASRQPWRVRRRAVLVMYLEAVLLAVPLLAFNYAMQLTPLRAGNAPDLATEAVLGIGAGVYEELVFRLILVSVLVMLGTDFLHLPQRLTLAVAVALAALAFASHHHPPLGSEPFAADAYFFRTIAGVYLGALFAWRGYGSAAGTHAAYNLLITFVG